MTATVTQMRLIMISPLSAQDGRHFMDQTRGQAIAPVERTDSRLSRLPDPGGNPDRCFAADVLGEVLSRMGA
jgi:hypothetical protein